jgi:hypothetical protein
MVVVFKYQVDRKTSDNYICLSYDAILFDDGMKTIIKYGIAFYKKECKAKNQSGYSGSASLLAHNLKATSDKVK